jgi:hypothetical protein
LADPLRDVSPGDPPGRLLNSSTFNLQMAVARWYRDNVSGAGRRAGAGEAQPFAEVPPRVEVRIKPESSVPEYGIVTLGAALIIPEDAPVNAAQTPIFEAGAPVAGGALAVCLAPIDGGKIGRAAVLGVVVCDVEVTDTGHQFADIDPANLFNMVSAETGPARLLHVDGTGTYKTLVLLQGDVGGGTAEAASCSWLSGLATTDCLLLTVVSATGRCSGIDTAQSVELQWDGADTWDGTTDFDHTGAGTPGAVVFDWANPDDPTLTIDGVSGKFWGCNGAGKLLFSFGGTDLCGGAAGSCNNSFTVAVECACCSIEGWDGPGWYCVLDEGGEDCETDPLIAAELTDADRCDTGVTICSGPYETEEEADAVCNPAPISVGGCSIPQSITAEYTYSSGNAGCHSGGVFPLTYNSGIGRWVGTGPLGGSSMEVEFWYDGSTWRAEYNSCATFSNFAFALAVVTPCVEWNRNGDEITAACCTSTSYINLRVYA